MVLECQGERWGECGANNAPVQRKKQQINRSCALLGFLIGRFADWRIMIYIPVPLALTFHIVGSDLPDDRAADDESGTDVRAGPAQSTSFDYASGHPS